MHFARLFPGLRFGPLMAGDRFLFDDQIFRIDLFADDCAFPASKF